MMGNIVPLRDEFPKLNKILKHLQTHIVVAVMVLINE